MAKVYGSILKNTEPTEYYKELVKFDRLDKLKKSLLKNYAPTTKRLTQITVDSQTQAFTNQYYYNQYSVNWLKPYNFSVVPHAAVQISVFKNRDFIKKIVNEDILALIPREPGTLKQVIAKNNIQGFNRIFSSIENSLLVGDSFDNTAKSLKDVFGSNFKNSVRIVRTEGHRNLESGSYTNFLEAQKKGVEGTREILSVLDNRTRTQSARVDGRKDTGKGFFYPNGQRYFIPGNTGVAAYDINDRETTITIVDGVSPEVRRARNPVTGKNEVINFKDFNVWAKENNLVRNKSGKLVTRA